MVVKAGSTATPKPAGRKTIAILSKELKSLESRLKGADTKNRNALKNLETVVSDLQAAAKTSKSTQKAALTRGLASLETQMETYLSRASEHARAGVRAELAAVTAPDAGVETINQAVQNAHARLDQLDQGQREAIARLNRHVAGLATSVEKRLSGETKARQASAAALDAKIDSVRKTFNTRVDQVEIDTTNALEAIGNRVAEFAEVLQKRSHASDADTAERLADLAQETQSDFNIAQTGMTARLEALETIAANWSPTEMVYPANMEDPRVDQMAQTVVSLQDELGRMHARLATIQNQAPADYTGQNLTDHSATSWTETPHTPTNVVAMSRPGQHQAAAPHLMDNPYAEAARALEASHAEVHAPIETAAPPPPSTAKSIQASHVPQEFDPTAFQTTMPDAQGLQTTAPLGYQPLETPPSMTPPPPVAPPVAPPMASRGAHASPHTAGVASPAIADPVMPAPLPVSTYDDPAYAEADDMRAERIGGDGGRKSALPKLPITGRNLRVGLMAATGVAVCLFAAKTILGGGGEITTMDAQNTAPSRAVSTDPRGLPPVNAANQGVAPASITAASEPLGSYAETRTPNISAEGQDTLDGAVAAGNPIAQFQKGLVQLRAGQMNEGARLIRLAANRNQPAAQYRLAKLYESGTGVAKDIVTARELVERAAIGGNRIAMHDLGNYYAQGEGGLNRDMTQALDWFSKAAERGVVDSQFNVAFLREGNEGVAADPEAALFWYYIAARQGDQGAPERIALLTASMDDATKADIKSRADRFNPKPVDEAANGIFRDVPWAKSEKTASAADTARKAQIIRVREAQTLLTDLGYQIGSADGAAGPRTRAAIKQFEAVNGLPETGAVTDELLQRLEIAAGV